VFRLIASPGKTVAIESPTYGHMLPLLHLSGLKPLEIPVREDGMDLTLLSRKIEKKQPSLLYTIPTFHNPTGVTTNQVHREHLYSICKRHRVPILEDGFDEEMKYFGRAVLPIKSMDTHNIVIYCGTFSKVLFPGVRIGWIVADRECIERLTAIRCFVDLSSSMILQASMYEFCRDGYYDRHISRMHRVFRKRMLTAIRTLREFISPEWAEWTEPNGGYLIWLKLRPAPAPPRDWEQLFASFGVKVAHGRRFFFSEPRDTYVRLSISTLDEDEIVEGVQRMSRALHEVHS
jgi:DNA-binding transcriptional MocR family regulator